MAIETVKVGSAARAFANRAEADFTQPADLGQNRLLNRHPLRYNLEPTGGAVRAKYRIGDSALWAGLGYAFASTSDTEVLLHGWRAWGPALLPRLRGMFAFALHDAERRETVLARDPLGIKPLYWMEDGRRLAFASEVQALRRAIGTRGLDPEGLASFLVWGSVAAPRTLYRGVHALPSGSWLHVRAEGVAG